MMMHVNSEFWRRPERAYQKVCLFKTEIRANRKLVIADSLVVALSGVIATVLASGATPTAVWQGEILPSLLSQ